LSKDQIVKVIDLALKMKKDPHAYTEALKHRTLLALFEKPSLRTRVSLEIGMTQVSLTLTRSLLTPSLRTRVSLDIGMTQVR
jgi:ornithine carbamoyltransferase